MRNGIANAFFQRSCSVFSEPLLFGVFHDLVTANICVAYFTIEHPKVIESQNPIFNSVGKAPQVSFLIIKRYITTLLLILPFTSLLAGLIGYMLALSGAIHFIGELARDVSIKKQPVFLAIGWAHMSSYIVGFVGGIVICMKVWMQRTRPNRTLKSD